MNTLANANPSAAGPQAGYTMALARFLMALIFLLSGLGKIGALDATRGYMEAMHLPGILLWPTIAFEVGSSVLVILGWRTRIVAALVAGFCLVSAAIFHTNFADQVQMIMFLKNVSMAGGFLLLAVVGPGSVSLDGRMRR
jgi:putative oxidoreductase